MSFILDALKKSENARQRQIGPSLADVPMRRKQNERPWWAFAVGALLVVNLVVLVVVLTRDGKDAKAEAAPQIPYGPPPRVAAPPVQYNVPQQRLAYNVRQPVINANAARSLAEEAGSADQFAAVGGVVETPGPAAAGNIPAGPSIVRPIEAPAVAPLPEGAAPDAVGNVRIGTGVGSNGSGGPEEILPTAGELTASGRNIPELKLDIHVYSRNAAERFVFVNMRKYQEGDTLSEGPALERITTDGVVLNQQGLRFVLPRR